MADEPPARKAAGGDPPWQQDHGSSDDLGASLKKHRQALEISLQEIAEHTRISESVLEAIEADRDDDLPAPVFVRGFLRQYARYVGLDPDQVVSQYGGSSAGRERPAMPTSRIDRDADAGAWVWVAVGVLLVAVGAGYWFYGRSSTSDDTPSTSPGDAASAAGEPDVAETAALPDEDPTAAGPEDPPLVAAGDGGDAAGPLGSGSEPVETRALVPIEQPATTLRVTIDFVEDCWVESSVDGVRQISTLYAKGESLRLEAETELRVFLGNYTGAVVQINGRQYEWQAGDPDDATRELSIDADFVAALSGGPPQASTAMTRPASNDLDAQAPLS